MMHGNEKKQVLREGVRLATLVCHGPINVLVFLVSGQADGRNGWQGEWPKSTFCL